MTNTNAGHTAELHPLKLVGSRGDGKCIFIHDTGGDNWHRCAVEVDSDDCDTDTAKAYAAKIVLAFNAHDALVAVCEEWVAMYDALRADEEPGDPLGVIRKQIHGARVDRTRAALNLAKKGA